MNGAAWFIVGVRLIGVWVLIEAYRTGLAVIVYDARYFNGYNMTATQAAWIALADAILALCLILGAPSIARLVCGRSATNDCEDKSTR